MNCEEAKFVVTNELEVGNQTRTLADSCMLMCGEVQKDSSLGSCHAVTFQRQYMMVLLAAVAFLMVQLVLNSKEETCMYEDRSEPEVYAMEDEELLNATKLRHTFSAEAAMAENHNLSAQLANALRRASTCEKNLSDLTLRWESKMSLLNRRLERALDLFGSWCYGV